MYSPMNAKAANGKLEKLMADPMYTAEIKYDGSRYLCDHGNFISRLRKDKTANVPHLSLLKGFNGVLDGEVYYPLGNSNETTRIMGSHPERAIELQQENGWIRYVVFDILEVDGKDTTVLPQWRRREILEESYPSICNPYVDISIRSDDKQKLLEYTHRENLEGIMLKNREALYYPGKRPEGCWYKVKKHMTDDVVITGFTEGAGKYQGLIGSIIFGKYVGDKLEEFGRCSGISDEVRKSMTDHPEVYVGMVMEISAMEGTAKGKYRHPQFKQLRYDKAPEDCKG